MVRRVPLLLACALLGAVAVVRPAVADAEDTAVPVDPEAAAAARGPGEGEPAPDDWSDKPWQMQPARPFIGGRMDIGILWLKPRLQFGYGKPHNLWAGIDVNPTVSFDAAGGYGGVRFDHPWVSFRFGARFVYSFEHVLLAERESYSHDDIELKAGERAQYWALDGELTLDPPLGPGELLVEIHGLRIMNVDEHFVYDERMDVVVDPPYALRNRLGYQMVFGDRLPTQIGLVGEGIWLPGRGEVVWRGGALVRMFLTHRFTVRGSFVVPLHSPDHLGLAGAEFAELSLRWRWATGAKAF